MTRFPHERSKQAILHLAAFIVAFCSFAYELVYSELLTVMYGGAVTQYGLTIGLFFSSLGLGSYLAQHLDEERHANFFRTEVYLALVAPAGFLFIIWVNSATLPGQLPGVVLQILSRLPVVLIGVLSGLELPLLLSMVRTEDGDTPPAPGWLQAGLDGIHEAVYRVVSVFFHASRDGDEYTTDSTVLAMDYLGGLAGALLHVFVLYPIIGLIPSIFVLALLNGVAGLLFAIRFSDRRWGLFRSENRRVLTREGTAVFLSCLVLTAGYGGLVLEHDRVDETVTEYYLEQRIESEYPQDTMDVAITEQYTTRYQQVTTYERSWVGESDNPFFPGESETCLRLDTAIQLCESWAEPYHDGLVDVPMSMYENSTDTEVLLVGGGDWIAVNHLRKHGASVDQVDIDGEFMDEAKTDSLLRRYHEGAYEYEHLDTYRTDIYKYLQRTDTKYDLVLLDLPGAKSDALSHLYSTEFYSLLRSHLSDQGVVTTWIYSPYGYPAHNKAYVNTVRDAGFDYQLEYTAYSDYNEDGELQRGERFVMFAPENDRSTIQPANGSAYVARFADRYEDLEWRATPRFNGVRVHSVFHPNYEIIIDRP